MNLLDILLPQIPAPVVGARVVLHLTDGHQSHLTNIDPQEDIRLRRLEQSIHKTGQKRGRA